MNPSQRRTTSQTISKTLQKMEQILSVSLVAGSKQRYLKSQNRCDFDEALLAEVKKIVLTAPVTYNIVKIVAERLQMTQFVNCDEIQEGVFNDPVVATYKVLNPIKRISSSWLKIGVSISV